MGQIIWYPQLRQFSTYVSSLKVPTLKTTPKICIIDAILEVIDGQQFKHVVSVHRKGNFEFKENREVYHYFLPLFFLDFLLTFYQIYNPTSNIFKQINIKEYSKSNAYYVIL